MSTVPPAVKWAERSDRLYVTVEAAGAKADEVQVVLEDSGKFEFKWKQFAFAAELLKEVVKEQSKWAVGGRGVVFDIVKKEPGYWNKLFKVPAGKPSWLGVDWARWKDEDDEDDEEENPMGNMDFSSLMGGMGGMGDMGDMGDEEEDDDDDSMPALEGEETEESKPEEEDEDKKKKEGEAAAPETA